MKAGDKVKFDHMGEEHTGEILKIFPTSQRMSFKVVRVKSLDHVSHIDINITLFPDRIRVIDKEDNQ